MGSIWGRQDPDGPHVGPMNFAIWTVPGYPSDSTSFINSFISIKEVVVMILFPADYKQWKTEYMSNIITTRKP